jgi:signal transduction histidine kinase
MYLNAVLGGIVMLVLFEPLRDKIGEYIHRAFLFERFDLERAVTRARQDLTHVLDVDEMQRLVIAALEDSRRVTAATFYLRDSLGAEFEAGFGFGGQCPARLEGASLGPLLEFLEQRRSIDFEALDTRLFAEESEPIVLRGQLREPSRASVQETRERVLQAAEGFAALRRGVCVGIFGAHGDLLGLLVVQDDRVRDAFSGDDLALLESLAVYISVVIENSRRHLRLQERARLAALGQLAAGLAHEIKNPLGAIKGAAQYLNEASDADPSAREFLEIIVEEVDRLDRVVRSVLDYARPATATLRTVDVHHVIERTLVVLRSSRDHQTSFAAQLDARSLFVRADPEQLKQVLINLVQNAIQAMSGNGEVMIRTRSRGARGGSFVEISVSDQGPGIETAVMKELFQPFFTTKASGTGLGLAITERIVNAMAGRIEVTSEPGVGATFTVVLPQSQAELSALEVSPDGEPGRI